MSGVAVRSGDGATTTLDADAVVLASGGFQGNPAMMRAQFGPGAETLRLISPGTRFDSGDGIRMATDQGASISGDWNGMHIEPIDPRSKHSAPVVLVYPYGIVVDQDGHRFFDEGGGLMHETWEALARDIHFARPNSIAYAILDARLFDIEGFERAIRSDVPPYQADSIEDLAAQIGVPARNLRETIDAFNAAATGDPARFDAARCDGLAAAGDLKPPKSNWARPIAKPPFLAYPLIGAIAYTFGGLADQRKGRSLVRAGADARPLRRGRNHRAFLRHRAECRCGAPRAGFWKNRGTGSCRLPAQAITSLRAGQDLERKQQWLLKITAPSSATSPKCPGANFPITLAARCRNLW